MPPPTRSPVSPICAWSPTDRFRCSTPAPPMRAMAMAIRASVTVSMAEETSGTFSVIRRGDRGAGSAPRAAGPAGEPGGRVRRTGHHDRVRGQQQDVVEGQGRWGELADVAHDTFRGWLRDI